MSGLLIGYARVSTEEQDLTAQRNGLAELGVDGERVYGCRQDVWPHLCAPILAPLQRWRAGVGQHRHREFS